MVTHKVLIQQVPLRETRKLNSNIKPAASLKCISSCWCLLSASCFISCSIDLWLARPGCKYMLWWTSTQLFLALYHGPCLLTQGVRFATGFDTLGPYHWPAMWPPDSETSRSILQALALCACTCLSLRPAWMRPKHTSLGIFACPAMRAMQTTSRARLQSEGR